MAHKPFTMYRRPSKGGKIFYVRFRDDDGNLMTARSSGQTTKGAAETWAWAQLKEGVVTAGKNVSFGQYAEDWWVYDKCPYVQGKLARGFVLSKVYANDMRQMLLRYILPRFKNVRMQKITPKMIEKWILDIRAEGKLANRTINLILQNFKIMMKEAVRLGYLTKNPAQPVQFLKANPKRKSILTVEDLKLLFGDGALERVWGNDLRMYGINLLGATSGLRMSEARGLLRACVFPGYIDVQWAFAKYGLQRPKRDSVRKVPIPRKTSETLQLLLEMSPYKEPEDYVFWGKFRHAPIYSKVVLDALYSALEKIGISKEERAKRQITYHSWRHMYNSLMRSRGIHDSKLRRLTGHRTPEMTEFYTIFTLDDYRDTLEVQEAIFK